MPLGSLGLLMLKGQTLLILGMLVAPTGPPWAPVPPGLLGLQPLVLTLQKPLVQPKELAGLTGPP